VYELGCLAVFFFGIEKFIFFLEHREFILQANNQTLSWPLSHSRQLEKIGKSVVKISCMKFKVLQAGGT
jgi:hypothetical protein